MTATEMPATDAPATELVPHSPIAMRNRRATLIVLSIVFALWVAGLLAMYFLTVYPQRHPKPGHAATVAPVPK